MGCGGSSEPALKDDIQDAPEPETLDANNVQHFLGKVPVFRGLSQEERELVASACTPHGFKRSEVIIKQGDMCSEFFLIMSGEVSVKFKPPTGPEEKVAGLKAGDYFGEAALLKDIPRSATIIAETSTSTLKITRERFVDLNLKDKLVFPARKAVGAAKHVNKAKAPSPKTPEERALIEKALQANESLHTTIPLTKTRLAKIIDLMWKETVAQGTDIIKQGDMDAHYFYVVQEGSFVVTVTETGKAPKVVAVRQAGTSFGEIALLYLSPRAATVKAKIKSVVWVIDRPNFQQLIMKEDCPVKLKEYVACLSSIAVFSPLLADEKEAIARALLDREYNKDDVIINQGEVGACMFILYEGEVSVFKDDVRQAVVQASGYSTAKVFGEQALITNEVRAATLRVISAKAKLLALDRESFIYLLGPLEDLMKREPDVAPRKYGIIQRKDLVSAGLLGCGGFGSVELVQHNKTEETYALKAVSKGYIVECGMEENIINEKNVLMTCDSPFIITLFETYNGSQSLYFLMEVCLGGELYSVYGCRNLFGSQPHAKYYSAGAICALEYLHKHKIVYRDLKPENMILTKAGHPKLIDMGLAKVIAGKTYTTCGTPCYFAPEVISQQGHCFAMDWWCVGILVFELCSGWPPFDAPDVMVMYKEIQKGFANMSFPSNMRGPCENFIREMCTLQPKTRLAIRDGGCQNIYDHIWWDGFDWEKFSAFDMKPPFKPQVKGAKDIANFNANKAERPAALKYEDPGTGWDTDFATVGGKHGNMNTTATSKE